MSWKAESFQDENYRIMGRYGEKKNLQKILLKNLSFVFHLLPPHPALFIFLKSIYCMEMPRMSQVQFKFGGPLLTVRDKLFKIFPRICPQSLWTSGPKNLYKFLSLSYSFYVSHLSDSYHQQTSFPMTKSNDNLC